MNDKVEEKEEEVEEKKKRRRRRRSLRIPEMACASRVEIKQQKANHEV